MKHAECTLGRQGRRGVVAPWQLFYFTSSVADPWRIFTSVYSLYKGTNSITLLFCGRHCEKHGLSSTPASQGLFSPHTWDTGAQAFNAMSQCLLPLELATQLCLWSPSRRQEEVLSWLWGSGNRNPSPPWHPDAAVTALGLSLHSLMTVCLPHRPASSSWGCPPTPASWSWLSACATPSTTAARLTWTTTCSRETWTTLRAPTPTTDCCGCRRPLFFSVMLTSSLMLIYFYGNYIDVLGT